MVYDRIAVGFSSETAVGEAETGRLIGVKEENGEENGRRQTERWSDGETWTKGGVGTLGGKVAAEAQIRDSKRNRNSLYHYGVGLILLLHVVLRGATLS